MPPSTARTPSSRTSTAHTPSSRGPASLPAYQPPTFPLNANALLALQSLPQSHPFTSLSKRQNQAYTHLCDLAGEINDRYVSRSSTHARRRERRTAQDLSDDEESEAKIRKMEAATKDLTTKMETAVRTVVDERARVEAMETALQELDTNLRDGSGRLAPTQSTLGASQFRSQRLRGANIDSDDDDDDEEEADSTQREGPTTFLHRHISAAETSYENLPPREKYASNNDYVAFRRILHDAQHPGDDAPPLPHASTWFASSSSTTTNTANKNNPSNRTLNGNGDAATNTDADDEDIQIASERRSIKCPLTLLPMRDPLSSTKCPHSFEKDAILSMLAASETRVTADGAPVQGGARGRRGGGAAQGEQAMKCPECQVLLTKSHLMPDTALARKIKRIQAKELARGQELDDEEGASMMDRGGRGGARGGREEGAGRGGRGDREEIMRIKAERGTQRAGASRDVSMVPNSQIEQGEEEEEEEAVEEETIGETQQ